MSASPGEMCVRREDGTYTDVPLLSELLGEDLTVLDAFNPRQPRDPEGTSTGGQWTAEGGGEKVGLDKLLEHFTVEEGDPVEFERIWNDHIRMDPGEFVREMDGGTGLFVGESKPEVRVLSGERLRVDLGDVEGTGDRSQMTRTFNFKARAPNQPGKYERAVDHDELVIVRSARGAGKQVMRSQFNLYRKLGIARVNVTAGMDVGAYAWARYGFVPTSESWNMLRQELSGALQDIHASKDVVSRVSEALSSDNPQGIWEIADSSIGKKLLISSEWDGTLSLHNVNQMSRLRKYVGR
jgi:hypothetical protein